MAWYFEFSIQCFSAAFDVLIKISESYRPQIPSAGTEREREREGNRQGATMKLAGQWLEEMVG